MKKGPASDLNDEMLDDYTGLLKKGIRGKYAGRIRSIQGVPVTPAIPVEQRNRAVNDPSKSSRFCEPE